MLPVYINTLYSPFHMSKNTNKITVGIVLSVFHNLVCNSLSWQCKPVKLDPHLMFIEIRRNEKDFVRGNIKVNMRKHK